MREPGPFRKGMSIYGLSANEEGVFYPDGTLLKSFGPHGGRKAIAYAHEVNRIYMAGYREALKDEEEGRSSTP